MDFIFDFILDVILEDGVNTSKKKSKTFRYTILGIIGIVYLAIIGLLMILGINTLKEDLFEGILIIVFGLCFLIVCIMRFKAVYQKRKPNKS